jgi:hypothetical protein
MATPAALPDVQPLSEADWRLILRRIRAERCVPFLGAGASLGTRLSPGLPTGATIARALAEECGYPGADNTDLLRVAQFYSMVFDEHEVREAIRRRINGLGVKPGTLHETIASLPFPMVLTTNFDRLMERAFEDAGKAPSVSGYERRAVAEDLRRPTPSQPLVYKLHGSIDAPHTMIVTEDDVIGFLACLLLRDPDLPSIVKQVFESHSLLFVGYGLKDWNIRVLMRAIRGKTLSSPPEMSCFAIQRRPEEENLAKEWETTVMYWGRRESLKCFDIDAIAFMTELKQRFESGEGQL